MPKLIVFARRCSTRVLCSRTVPAVRRGVVSSRTRVCSGICAPAGADTRRFSHVLDESQARARGKRPDDGAHNCGSPARQASIARRCLCHAGALNRRPADFGEGRCCNMAALLRRVRRNDAEGNPAAPAIDAAPLCWLIESRVHPDLASISSGERRPTARRAGRRDISPS